MRTVARFPRCRCRDAGHSGTRKPCDYGEHPCLSVCFFAVAAANCCHSQFTYFVVVCIPSCYGSRTIRLAVMYNARARKAVPWLTSVRFAPLAGCSMHRLQLVSGATCWVSPHRCRRCQGYFGSRGSFACASFCRSGRAPRMHCCARTMQQVHTALFQKSAEIGGLITGGSERKVCLKLQQRICGCRGTPRFPLACPRNQDHVPLQHLAHSSLSPWRCRSGTSSACAWLSGLPRLAFLCTNYNTLRTCPTPTCENIHADTDTLGQETGGGVVGLTTCSWCRTCLTRLFLVPSGRGCGRTERQTTNTVG